MTAQGVQLCERQVDHLYARYQVLVGCAERLERQQLVAIVQARGGLIIDLDGLEPEGATEQLWVVREVQTERTLVAGWLPRVNHETLAALLQPVVDLGLPVLATVSDKQGCVRKALQFVWPAVPHQWCQSHYLGHAMHPIYDQDAALKTELRKTLRADLPQPRNGPLGRAGQTCRVSLHTAERQELAEFGQEAVALGRDDGLDAIHDLSEKLQVPGNGGLQARHEAQRNAVACKPCWAATALWFALVDAHQLPQRNQPGDSRIA